MILTLIAIASILFLLCFLLFIYSNTPLDWSYKYVIPTTSFLRKSTLILVEDEDEIKESNAISGDELLEKPALVMVVRRPGDLFCRREAANLSTLKPLLSRVGMRLFAVTHQSKGISDFKSYFNGDVYLDKERIFYGPNERWMPIWRNLLRLALIPKLFEAGLEGATGNLHVGDPRLLGGVFVIDGDTMVWSHLEKEWGDTIETSDVRAAIMKWAEKPSPVATEATTLIR